MDTAGAVTYDYHMGQEPRGHLRGKRRARSLQWTSGRRGWGQSYMGPAPVQPPHQAAPAVEAASGAAASDDTWSNFRPTSRVANQGGGTAQGSGGQQQPPGQRTPVVVPRPQYATSEETGAGGQGGPGQGH